MRRRFFVERFDGSSAVLRGEAAHHLGRVLRAQPGQLYELSDGAAVWLARTERVSRDAVEFSLIEPLPVRQPRLHLTLLLAIVKFDRFEWSLEKATELGVAEVVPLAAARSEKALVAAAAKRAARWQKILLESAQQARRLRPPFLLPLARPREAFQKAQAATKLLLSERPDAPRMRRALEPMGGVGGRSFRSEVAGASSGASAAEATSSEVASAVLAVGPEGGWTDGELLAAREAGFTEASLGEHILRAETAVVAALASLNYALGD